MLEPEPNTSVPGGGIADPINVWALEVPRLRETRAAKTCDSGRSIHLYTGRRFPPIQIRSEDRNDDSSDTSKIYEVCIIDNDYNTYQEVMDVTMLVLGINDEQAFAVAWEVDHRGSCVVAQGPREEAETIADMIRTIGIEVQVNPVSGLDR
jgi:ATP-dependent Clp protease adapter protein ClpS